MQFTIVIENFSINSTVTFTRYNLGYNYAARFEFVSHDFDKFFEEQSDLTTRFTVIIEARYDGDTVQVEGRVLLHYFYEVPKCCPSVGVNCYSNLPVPDVLCPRCSNYQVA